MRGHVFTSAARPNIHSIKVMLRIWWDQLGVEYYELLKMSEIITGNQYRSQLMDLSRALKEKRPKYQEGHDKVILQHDNALSTCRKIGQDILGNAEMEGFTLLTLLFRRCSLRLPFVSIDGTWPDSSAFPLL